MPQSLSQLSSLECLSLAGGAPRVLSPFMGDALIFNDAADLSNNSFQGALPTQIYSLPLLQELYLSSARGGQQSPNFGDSGKAQVTAVTPAVVGVTVTVTVAVAVAVAVRRQLSPCC